MPKKTRKQTGERGGGGRGSRLENNGAAAAASDEESVCNDDASVISNASSGSVFGDEVNEEGGASNEELSPSDAFEEKLREAMDLAAGQKSGQSRTTALQGICRALLKKFIPEFVEERRMTLTDLADRGLKRGKDSEQLAAANLAILVCVQLGESTSAEEAFASLSPTLTALALDPAACTKSRGAAANALGVACFLACDAAEFAPVLETLEKVFHPSSLGGVQAGSLGSEATGMHAEALSAWSLLLTVAAPGKAKQMLGNQITSLSAIFDSPDVELRIAAGEALAILYESSVEADEQETMDLVEPLLPQLKQLATDSHKYRSKKDRKEQKSSFRDILKLVEDEEEYYERIKINGSEALELESWAQKKQYDLLCKVLSSGMNLHLTENELLRDIFQLGAPIPQDASLHLNKPTKLERHSANQQADKLRNKARGKNRDKRSAVV